MGTRIVWISLLTLGCATIPAPPREVKQVPQPEQEELYPVGGYEMLAGLWVTDRVDRRGKAQRVPLRVELDEKTRELRATVPPDFQGAPAVRVSCNPQHRLCVGNWYDGHGRGNMVWRFATDFASFTGHYSGIVDGYEIQDTPWTGSLQRR